MQPGEAVEESLVHRIVRRLICKPGWYLMNHVWCGTEKRYFERKRRFLIFMGHQIGEGTKVVGPVWCTGRLVIGKDCWIGKNLLVNGNGTVTVGDCCDIAPEVAFQTGGHRIGSAHRRAGKGVKFNIEVGNGCWIGARSTILGGVHVGDSCVVAACACVNKDVPANSLVGGVPAKIIRELSEDGED